MEIENLAVCTATKDCISERHIAGCPKKRKIGFATMSKEKVRELARAGGLKVQSSGRAHKWTSAEAKVAGAKGGMAPKRKSAAV